LNEAQFEEEKIYGENLRISDDVSVAGFLVKKNISKSNP